MNPYFKYVLAAVLIAAAVAAYAMYKDKGVSGEPRACTMEAKLCPDGSAVGRTGPNCEFAPCPAPRSY